ncbi:Lipocalin/cytosolic fatty-acid binding domain, partial [Trinorchestia longiramus]
VLSVAQALDTSNYTCAQPPPASNYANRLYEGRWYEMGRVQTQGGAVFQVGCMCSTDDFTSDEPEQGNATVSYTCRRFSPDNDPAVANATLVDTGVPGAFLQVYPYPNSTPLNYFVVYVDEV